MSPSFLPRFFSRFFARLFPRFFFVFLFLSAPLGAVDLVKIYLDEGLGAVGEAIEKELLSKNYWLGAIGDQDVSLGFYSEDVAIVLTNKAAKSLAVYFYEDGRLEKKFDQKDIITGLMGNKHSEGDLKTPVGFYELGRKFDPRDPYYGPLAFATTYPNLLDKLQGKTGGGIWIHGYPLDGQRLDEYKTRGCIVLRNETLPEFARVIEGKKTYVFTEEQTQVRASKDEVATVLASLFAWKLAWTISDLDAYLAFYDEAEFRRFDKSNFKQFRAMKAQIFARREDKSIKFSKLNISPYPNLDGEKIYRIGFYENYSTKNYKFNGPKTLYIKLDEQGRMRILAEQ